MVLLMQLLRQYVTQVSELGDGALRSRFQGASIIQWQATLLSRSVWGGGERTRLPYHCRPRRRPAPACAAAVCGRQAGG